MGVFLFFSLFFPRISLLLAYMAGGMPSNDVPLFIDVVSALFIPRLLIIYYIWFAELGAGWMAAHIIALIIKVFLKAISEKD